MLISTRLSAIVGFAMRTLPARAIVFGTLIWVFDSLDCAPCGFALVILLLFVKSLQLASAIWWILHHGEKATKEFFNMEANIAMRPDLSRDIRIGEFRKVQFAYFKANGPKTAILGLLDWKLRVSGSTIDWLRYYFFRFNTQSLLASLVLLFTASPSDAQVAFTPHELRIIVLGALLLLNCFIMGAEILVGNALMGKGYSRFFHPESGRLFTSSSHGMHHLQEVVNFSRLALTTLIAIASTCTAYSIMYHGFNGTSVEVTLPAGGIQWATQRILLWLEFLYFATTTFSTVGFGDIHPNGVGSRALVTIIHFLTFGYVLFLLQTILGRDESPVSADESAS